jgi:molybdenum cofactor guanylyltransferase
MGGSVKSSGSPLKDYSDISAVILAGGRSTRFGGRIKSKELVNGIMIIDRIINVLDKIFGEIIIVTNTPEEFSGYRNCTVVTDILKDSGPLGGIHAAASVSSGKALFVVAGDMPFLDAGLIRRLVDFAMAKDSDAVIPAHEGQIEPLHGIYSIASGKKIEELFSAAQGRSVRDLLKIISVCYFEVSDSDCVSFININTPDDLFKYNSDRNHIIS